MHPIEHHDLLSIPVIARKPAITNKPDASVSRNNVEDGRGVNSRLRTGSSDNQRTYLGGETHPATCSRYG